jgi:hypothetical protein
LGSGRRGDRQALSKLEYSTVETKQVNIDAMAHGTADLWGCLDTAELTRLVAANLG